MCIWCVLQRSWTSRTASGRTSTLSLERWSCFCGSSQSLFSHSASLMTSSQPSVSRIIFVLLNLIWSNFMFRLWIGHNNNIFITVFSRDCWLQHKIVMHVWPGCVPSTCKSWYHETPVWTFMQVHCISVSVNKTKKTADSLHCYFLTSDRVIKYGENNRMTVQNVAIVFGPTLLRPEMESANIAMHMVFQNQIVEFILNEYERIFCSS